MSETYRCGDYGALTAYLYDECEPDERVAIEAHLAICAACADELQGLEATRHTLSAWAPPDVRLGFQVTERPHEPAARVLRPAAWWRQPLPAWAQAAAAVVIFASGMAIGVARSGGTAAASAAAAPRAQVSPASAVSSVSTVTPQDLAAVEQRLRGEIAQVRQATPVRTTVVRNDDELLRQVRAMITDSEQRQRREFAVQTAQVVRSFDTQRRIDLAQVQRNIGQIQEVAGAAVRGQSQMVNYLMNVSQQR